MNKILLVAAFALVTNFSVASPVFAGTAAAAQQCDPGFKWVGLPVGCLGTTITDRSVLKNFDVHDADCKPGETRTIQQEGVMPNGRHVTWDVVQECTAD